MPSVGNQRRRLFLGLLLFADRFGTFLVAARLTPGSQRFYLAETYAGDKRAKELVGGVNFIAP